MYRELIDRSRGMGIDHETKQLILPIDLIVNLRSYVQLDNPTWDCVKSIRGLS